MTIRGDTDHLFQGPIIIGCADGKVRACHCKTNKAQTLYNTDSLVCSIGRRKENSYCK